MKTSEELTDRQKKFIELKTNQPSSGDILVSRSGEKVFCSTGQRTEAGKRKRAIFVRAVVDVDKEGWFLENENKGIICLILPYSQPKLTQHDNGDFSCTKLKVVRYTTNGRSLLCEVVD